MIFLLIFFNLLFQSVTKLNSSLNSIYLYRLNVIGIFFAILLLINNFIIPNINAIGSDLVLFNGYIYVSLTNQYIEILIYLISLVILISIKDTPIFYKNLTLIKNLNISKIKNEDRDKYLSQLDKTSSTILTNVPFLTQTNSLNISPNWLNYYPLIVLFNLLGASLLISSYDLLLLYIAIELQSYSLYILSSLNKDSIQSTKAGLSYFLIGGFASCIILLGISLIYSSTGITNLDNLSIFIGSEDYALEAPGYEFWRFYELGLNSFLDLWIKSGFLLIILGLLIKTGAAPFHQWAPEVYDKVSIKVTIWLVLIPKLSIFLVIFELFNLFSISHYGISDYCYINLNLPGYIDLLDYLIFLIDPENYPWNINSLILNEYWFLEMKYISLGYFLQEIIIFSSFISLVVGSLLGLSQIRIKKLLAFSAISHIGFILLSLSLDYELSVESFFFYLIQYSITNLNIFIILILINNKIYPNTFNTKTDKTNYKNISTNQPKYKINTEELVYIKELSGLFKTNPILSLSLTISVFSLAGVPPLMGFFGKQQVLFAAITGNYYFISIIAIIMSVISSYYYLNVIKVLHFDVSTDLNNKYNLAFNFTLNNIEKLLKKVQIFSTKSETNLSEKVKNVSTSAYSHGDVVCRSFSLSYSIAILTFILLFFILKSKLILNSTHILALFFFYLI